MTSDQHLELGVNPAAPGVAGWLALAAAPTFAFMALLTVLGSGSDTLCSAGRDASPLTGMVAMYLLMSAFHSAPWLKLVFSRQHATPADTDPSRP